MKRSLWIVLIILCLSAVAYAAYDYNNAAIDGRDYGAYIGSQNGKTDALANKPQNYAASMPNTPTAISGFINYKFFGDAAKQDFVNNKPITYDGIFYEAFKPSYEASYNEAYEKNKQGTTPPSSQTELAKTFGKKAGEIDGKLAGEIDAAARVKSDWHKALYGDPKEPGYPLYPKTIEELYNLANETGTYKSIFLNEYLQAYRKAYEQAFSTANFNGGTGGETDGKVPEDPEKVKGAASGKVFGENEGYRAGVADYFAGKEKSSTKAMKTDAEIVKAFMLENQNSVYRSTFMNTYKAAFKTAYDDAYRNANMDPRQTAYTDGFTQGASFGSTDGMAAGRKDYYNGKANNWTLAILSDEEIANQYELEKEIKEYRFGFINGYKINFESQYTKLFREAKNEYITQMSKNAEANATKIGKAAGIEAGQMDFVSNKKNNWYEAIGADVELIKAYGLEKESSKYKEDFLAFYKKAFMENYIEQFQLAKTDIAEKNQETFNLNGMGGIITYESKDGFNEMIQLELPADAILRKTAFVISQNEYLAYYFEKKYVPLTNVYEIKVKNDLNKVQFYRTGRVSITYHGPQTASIYENIGGQWRYLETRVYATEEGLVATAEMNHKQLSNVKYAVFLDEGYRPLLDIEGHWAKQEIELFTKRYYVNGYPDGTFRPNRKVTRAEFITMIDKAIGLDDKNKMDVSQFKDSVTFGGYSEVISKALGQKIIQGYSDGTFRPNMPISYQEVEWIVSKLPLHAKFKWQTIADKMLDEKKVYANSRKSKKEYINRAEVVYMLYQMMNIKEIAGE